jgi:hypothetical protein
MQRSYAKAMPLTGDATVRTLQADDEDLVGDTVQNLLRPIRQHSHC